MSGIEAIGLIITAVIVPYVVQLIKTKAITGTRAQWLAIGVSIVAGIVTGLAAGIPSTPTAWVTCILAAIGAVQIAYSAFKSVGVTSNALDALMAVNNKVEDTPEIVKKKQSMTDKAEDAQDREE